jgi:subtilisin-like proprotein convertase family protein
MLMAVFTNSTPTNILDQQTVTSTIVVSGANSFLLDVNLQTFLTHTFSGDLDITLTSPGGTIIKLSTDNGGSNDNVFNGTVWDDSANPGTTDEGLVTGHTYQNNILASPLVPEGSLGAFVGEDPNGTWTITITDDSGVDVGVLNSWSLDVTAPLGLPSPGGYHGFTNATPLALVDGGVSTSTIVVSGLGTRVMDLDLQTFIRHVFSADLDITLTSPAGTVVTITTDNGGMNDDVFNGTVWDNAAAQTVVDATYVNGVPLPSLSAEESLGVFVGENPNGTWTLTISDDGFLDTGTLDSWSLAILTYILAPTDIALSNAAVAENSPNGTIVGTLSATDPDPGDTATFSLADNAGGRFAISGSNLVVADGALLYFESNTAHSVTVRATDSAGLTFDKVFNIAVNNVSEIDPNAITHWMASVDIAAHPPGWLRQGTGDFNADGTDDVAWYNASTSNIDFWMLSNGQWSGSVSPGSHPTGYQPVGFSDYSGDGNDDVLWFNPTTRDVDLWKIVDGEWAGSVNIGPHPTGFQPTLSGDFNGDGTSDIAWHNPTTNNIDVWKIVDGHWAGSIDVGPHPAGYQPALAGDFNGDGTDDIAWYNPTNGDIDIWKMSNGQWAGSVATGPHPLGWLPLGAADFNLDGTDDIAWQNPATRNIDIWLLQNGQWSQSINVGVNPGPVVAVGVGDFDHNGVADIMWRDTTTGHLDNWMLTYS